MKDNEIIKFEDFEVDPVLDKLNKIIELLKIQVNNQEEIEELIDKILSYAETHTI